MGRGEEEPAPPDATMLMGDEVLREEEIKRFVLSDDCFFVMAPSKTSIDILEKFHMYSLKTTF